MRRLGLIVCISVVLFLLLQSHTVAQSASNLQADIFDLRSQVSELRAQVAQLSRQGQPGTRLSVPIRPPHAPNDSTDSQIIDRLSILAIEAKDRLNTLEARVSKLEKRLQ